MTARTLQELVAAAASLYPDRTAVMFDSGSGLWGSEGSGGSGGPVCMSYRDLSRLAEELSGVLLRSCSPRARLIGLYCTEDLFVPVWILGSVSSGLKICACPQYLSELYVLCFSRILQSSAGYVPLDPEAPGPVSARVMSGCGLRLCAVRSDLLQV